MRADLEIIQEWIPNNSRILDLGCGDGELLSYLTKHKAVSGYGLEIDSTNINQCLQKGVNVIQQNLDEGLANFATQSFDVVIMTQAIQVLNYPDKLLQEMLRVGKTCIITFPNFGHWRCRLYLSLKGKMPVSEFLPYTWYNTPNIHFCTFKDFENLTKQLGAKVLQRLAVNSQHHDTMLTRLWPNLMSEIGIYQLTSNS
ncbi:methionine biosynthesis protein MetW [Entomomonas sp. E2T0]|uniref:methionine biosynthesis protein MetW n=1 Tax=Entomomonas sp. E2T0 TaxID=2930213 RepID=UPI0022281DCD|nr:methionine biosynthesis protein MetW [Entomomonas sp. E2T0]UYZ83832.1 methionine biosynthesis protein MetW [Entomomonas sp. E2T0]